MEPSSRAPKPHCAGDTVLITGFDAFGPHGFNSSEMVVEALRVRTRPQWVLTVLPTSYERARAQVLALLEKHRPQFALHLGLAADTDSLRFEQSARNLDHSTAVDNDGQARQGLKIASEAPDTYDNALNFRHLQSIAEAAQERVLLSQDCGGFVCNHVFFQSAHFLASSPDQGVAGFLHLPTVLPSSPRLIRLSKIIEKWLQAVSIEN